MARVLRASLVIMLGALASCGRPEARPARPDAVVAAPTLTPAEAAESLAARTEARRGSLVRKPGSTVAGDAVSRRLVLSR